MVALDARTRRRAERVPYHMKTTVYGHDAFAGGVVRNLSALGAFVESWQPLQPGEEVDLDLDLPDGTYTVRGRVAWAMGPGGSTAPGMGVEFTVIPPACRDALEAFVARRLAEVTSAL